MKSQTMMNRIQILQWHSLAVMIIQKLNTWDLKSPEQIVSGLISTISFWFSVSLVSDEQMRTEPYWLIERHWFGCTYIHAFVFAMYQCLCSSIKINMYPSPVNVNLPAVRQPHTGAQRRMDNSSWRIFQWIVFQIFSEHRLTTWNLAIVVAAKSFKSRNKCIEFLLNFLTKIRY